MNTSPSPRRDADLDEVPVRNEDGYPCDCGDDLAAEHLRAFAGSDLTDAQFDADELVREHIRVSHPDYEIWAFRARPEELENELFNLGFESDGSERTDQHFRPFLAASYPSNERPDELDLLVITY